MHWRDQRIPYPQYRRIRKRFPRYLPHWDLEEGTFFLTWRLHDALPASALATLRLETLELRQRLLEADLDPREKEAILAEFERRYDDHLDRGFGNCWLEREPVAELIAGNLEFHDGKLYHRVAWAVMPNHVHAVLRLIGSATLARVMHALKSYTAKEANAVLGRRGTFWQDDYFDRLIRSEEDLLTRVQYVVNNPAKGGLRNWKWVGLDEKELQNCRIFAKWMH
jgi:hypothetical protein